MRGKGRKTKKKEAEKRRLFAGLRMGESLMESKSQWRMYNI